MSPQDTLFDIGLLARHERLCRTRLAREPGDLLARVGLAWCLFLQALHLDGHDNLAAAFIESGIRLKPPRRDSTQDGVARDLLNDCLLQANIVRQLSGDGRFDSDVQKLQGLVKLCGAEEAVREAKDDASVVLDRVMQELIHGIAEES